MKNKKNLFQLYIMMFMQYFIFAVWWVPFAAYLSNTLQLEVFQVSLILCTMAIGSMASPFIGFIADRCFPAQKVLVALNLLTAAPKEMRAQAQGFLSFIIWGVGYLIGTLLNGWMIGNYRLEEKCNWSILFIVSTVFTLVLAVFLIILFQPVINMKINHTNQ